MYSLSCVCLSFGSAAVDGEGQQEVSKGQKGFRKEIQGQLREQE